MTSVDQHSLVVVRHSLRNRGGDAVILERMSFLAEQGWMVRCYVNQVDTQFKINPKIHLQNIPGRGVLSTILFALNHKHKTGIVLLDLAVMALFSCVRNRPQVVLFSQEDDRSYYHSWFSKTLVTWSYQIVFWLKVPVLCVSDSLSHCLRTLGASQVITIPNGIDTGRFLKRNLSPYFKEKKSSVAVIFYARRDYRKGMDVALKALEELYVLRPEGWELWVIGEEMICIKTPLLNIKSLGILNEEQLSDLLCSGDIFLSSSRQEGFGLLQLQAMACGCALVTTDAFSLAKNEVNALVSAINDSHALAVSLDRLIKDNDLRLFLGKNAAAFAQEYPQSKGDQIFQEALLRIYSVHSVVS